jgi:hypothetical protein
VQSEKASDYNYYDYYADDVEDVHLVCSSLVETNRCKACRERQAFIVARAGEITHVMRH